MPKPHNPVYPWDGEFVINFTKKILEDKIFTPAGKIGYAQKAAYLKFLGGTVKAGNVKLEPAPLVRNLIRPYTTYSDIQLSDVYARDLCHMIFDHKDLLKLDEKDIVIVEEFLRLYHFEKREQKKGVNSKDIIEQLIGKNKEIRNFVDKEFLIYERIGDEVKKDGKWGIAIGKIYFTAGDNYIHAETTFMFDGKVRKHQGIASHDKKVDYLFVDQLITDDTGRRSNLVLRITDMDINDESIILGHFTYHSKQYNHLLSKTVVIQQAAGKVELKEIGNYLSDDENYEKIPVEIRTFLYEREKNRMSHPLEMIANLTQLAEFLKKHKMNKVRRILKKHMIGTFNVYYKRIDNTVVEDKLEICFNEQAVRAEGVFIHSPDEGKENEKKWVGEAYVNMTNRVCVLELSNEKSIEHENEEEEDPILLSFCLPNDTKPFTKSECFPGLITGLEDSNSGPVSYKCLIIKPFDDFHGLNDARIKRIFETKRPLGLYIDGSPMFSLDDFSFV